MIDANRHAEQRSHELSAWNAWVAHAQHCGECELYRSNPAEPRKLCADGKRLHSTWRDKLLSLYCL